MRATLKDIAEATGYSISSVSLVLNDRPNRISAGSREKILQAAKRLDYHPNQAAVSLITRRSNIIGLIVPDITNMFFAQVAKGAETRSSELGYSLVLCNTNDEPEKDLEYLGVLLDRGADGILLVSSYQPGIERKPLDGKKLLSEKPVVLVDRNADRLADSGRYSGVFSDNELGAYLATKHLLSLGHKKIGCITGPMAAASSKNRLFGYIRALQEAELPFDNSLVREGNYRIDTGFEFGSQLIDAGASAIFAFNDMMAYGVYRAAGEKGVSIPDDLSVIGYDDLPFSEIAEPPLTSVRQGAYNIGVEAVNAIVRQIDAPQKKPEMLTLRPELIVRKSVKQIDEG